MPVRRTLAATAVAIAAGSGMVATPARAASTDTYVVTCAGTTVTKPPSITITCADAGVTITRIVWSTWNANEAMGTGVLAWNTCLPTTCVDGIVQRYRVRITLGGVASGPDLTVFSRLNVRFPKGGPAALETGSYTIDNTAR